MLEKKAVVKPVKMLRRRSLTPRLLAPDAPIPEQPDVDLDGLGFLVTLHSTGKYSMIHAAPATCRHAAKRRKPAAPFSLLQTDFAKTRRCPGILENAAP